MPENLPEDHEVFQYMMLNDVPEEEPEEIERMIIHAQFQRGNYQKFRIEVVKVTNPAGFRIYGMGDHPPVPPTEAMISYVIKDAIEKRKSQMYAIGQVLFNLCLDYADRYYVKLPYKGEDGGNTRYWIQSCGSGDDRHWHVIELDNVTREPVNLVRDMANHHITTVGEALETIAPDWVTHEKGRGNPIEKILKHLASEARSEQPVEQAEEHEETTTPTSVLEAMWNAGSSSNDDDDDDE